MNETTTPTETWDERMTREKAERQARELAFCGKIEKAYELCGLEVFGIEESEYNDSRKATVKGSSKSAYISASFDRYGHKGRICIGLCYTGQLSARDVWGYDATHEEITVSGEKTSEQIAADIKRRILPKLADSITKADSVIKSRNDYTDKTEENVIALGGRKRDDRGNVDKVVHIEGGTAEVFGDSVKFTLYSVDIKTAKKIVSVLKSCKAVA